MSTDNYDLFFNLFIKIPWPCLSTMFANGLFVLFSNHIFNSISAHGDIYINRILILCFPMYTRTKINGHIKGLLNQVVVSLPR